EGYFKLCTTTPVVRVENGAPVQKRAPFLDHGIMSALVLLKAADIQRYYVRELTGMDFTGTLDKYPKLKDILNKQETKDSVKSEQFFIRFSHVAGAIALHNISPHLYTQEQCT